MTVDRTLSAFSFRIDSAACCGSSAFKYAYRTFAREQGIDIPAHPGPNGSKPPSLDC